MVMFWNGTKYELNYVVSQTNLINSIKYVCHVNKSGF